MNTSKEYQTLKVLLDSHDIKWSVDETIRIFKNKKVEKQKILLLIQEVAKNDEKIIAEFEKLCETSENYFSPLLHILVKYQKKDQSKNTLTTTTTKKSISFSTELQQQSMNSMKFDSPKLSSTTIVPKPITPDNSLLAEWENIKSNRSATQWNFDDFQDSITYQLTSTIGMPFSSQEAIVVKEVLYCLVGIRGSLIKPKKNDEGVMEFTVSSDLPETLRDLLLEITPLASYYANIQTFIHYAMLPKNGQVLHSLSDALKTILYDYFMSIGNLETMHSKHKLSLHKIIYFLRPITIIMEKISSIITTIREKEIRGGSVLTLLHERSICLSGDKSIQDILKLLSNAAAVPYINMLKLWISKGIICDPGSEFFIIDCQSLSENKTLLQSIAYWEDRYDIQPSKIPSFYTDVADKILRTGKYLNVIRECGKPLRIEGDVDFKFIHSEKKYAYVINEAYNYASSSLLALFMDEYDLLGRFLSVKRYFLLQQGDFVAQFMDACEQELMKNVEKVIPMKLKSLLELTLRMSSAKFDKYQDDLTTFLLPYGLLTQVSKLMNDDYAKDMEDPSELTGIDCFSFGYEVEWPMSIVFNQGVIVKYQMIFRELFYFKHVERLLHRLWTISNDSYNNMKDRRSAIDLYRSSFTLRQRMMNALQNIEYYLMIEVIEQNWHLFFQKLGKVKNIDEVLILHQEFLDDCLRNCMLVYPTLLKAVMSVCNICIEFCEFIQIESEKQVDAGFQDKVQKFSEDFTTKILSLLHHIHELSSQDTKFLNLVHRINSYGFYTENKSV